MPIYRPAALLGALAVTLAACGEPPEYRLLSTTPVTVSGQTCTAELSEVTYSRLFQIGQPEAVVTRDTGQQYEIVCGARSHLCRLDQGLEACIADIESERRRDDDDDGGYTPPT